MSTRFVLQLTAALSAADAALDVARAHWAALTPVLDAVREGRSAHVRFSALPDHLLPCMAFGQFQDHRARIHVLSTHGLASRCSNSFQTLRSSPLVMRW